MALAYTSVKSMGSAGDVRYSVTDIALDNLYTTGGYVLTPQLLGLPNAVTFGNVTTKTVVAAGPSEAFLDCSTPTAPKLKLSAPTAEEAANVTLTGAIVEVTAYGY